MTGYLTRNERLDMAAQELAELMDKYNVLLAVDTRSGVIGISVVLSEDVEPEEGGASVH